MSGASVGNRESGIGTRAAGWWCALGVAAVVGIAACSTVPTVPNNPQMVIQAYLYSGEPVRDIHITATLPLGDSATVADPITDAVVTLIKAGRRYALVASAGDSGYYEYPSSDLVVADGDTFNIEVKYQDITATAQTVVPQRTGAVMLSRDTIVVPSAGGSGRGGPGGLDSTTRLVARWPNVAKDLYFVTIEAADSNAAAVGGGRGGRRRFIFAPSAVDSFTVLSQTLQYYGTHHVQVYHVNKEYAALYESRQQDTRDLNEPATNIKNSLGVFTAFSSAIATFIAVAR